MMKHLLSYALVVLLLVSCSNEAFHSYQCDSPIYPDYRDVTVPGNIAPLNFSYVSVENKNTVTEFAAGDVCISFKGANVFWKRRQWRKILAAAALTGEISVKSTAVPEGWKIFISKDEIDYGVTYRLIPPGYGLYGKLGIYEYCFEDGSQKTILRNEAVDYNCMNCHSFKGTDPNYMSLHIRGTHNGTLLLDGNDLTVFNTMTANSGGNCVYPYWHPSGNYIAFSVNKTQQTFFVNPEKLIEVYDNWSDLWVYDVRKNRLSTNNSLKTTDWLETFPAFSADGARLFFCRAVARDSTASHEDFHYNLCSVSFDPETGNIGSDVETLVDAESVGKSALFPRPSYDGRFLVYTLCDFGTFPIWHKESDLWMLDLSTGKTWPMDGANSTDTESYHSWSTNSRWMVFSSRRDDTRFTRLYVSHIDENGKAGKAFMLPQRNPVKYYNELFNSYNVPNFVSGPVELPRYKSIKAITSNKRKSFEN